MKIRVKDIDDEKEYWLIKIDDMGPRKTGLEFSYLKGIVVDDNGRFADKYISELKVIDKEFVKEV